MISFESNKDKKIKIFIFQSLLLSGAIQLQINTTTPLIICAPSSPSHCLFKIFIYFSILKLECVLNVYQSKWGNNSFLVPKPSIIGDKVAEHFSQLH